MKKGIHPAVHTDTKATCSSCGAVFVISSVLKEISIETCSQCNPVYTGKFRALANSGRVERFQKKLAEAKKADSEDVSKKKRSRNLTPDEKLELKLKESQTKKIEEKAEKEAKKHEQAKRAAARTVVKKGKKE